MVPRNIFNCAGKLRLKSGKNFEQIRQGCAMPIKGVDRRGKEVVGGLFLLEITSWTINTKMRTQVVLETKTEVCYIYILKNGFNAY